jgi:hypothetical protein
MTSSRRAPLLSTVELPPVELDTVIPLRQHTSSTHLFGRGYDKSTLPVNAPTASFRLRAESCAPRRHYNTQTDASLLRGPPLGPFRYEKGGLAVGGIGILVEPTPRRENRPGVLNPLPYNPPSRMKDAAERGYRKESNEVRRRI